MEREERRSFSAIATYLYEHNFIRPPSRLGDDFTQEDSLELIQSPVDMKII